MKYINLVIGIFVTLTVLWVGMQITYTNYAQPELPPFNHTEPIQLGAPIMPATSLCLLLIIAFLMILAHLVIQIIISVSLPLIPDQIEYFERFPGFKP